MYILGISAYYHDSAAVLIKDGEIIAAAQEERFTRKKHDSSFPKNAVSFCLNCAGIDATKVDYVAFYEKPILKFERILETYLHYAPKGYKSFIKAIPLWIKEKIWIKDLIAGELNSNGQFLLPEHHQSHAASAFFPSPFKEAAFLTLDGVGEWATTSYGIGKDNNLQALAEIKFPHSIGLLYSAFTYYLGFKVNSGEYKVMGLAPYGEPKYKEKILNELLDLKEDGSFRLNMGYFDFASGLKMTNRKFDKLFGGPPRKPETLITQKEMDLARSIQEVTEEVILKMGAHIRKETGKKKLCLAGGAALNCVANGKLLRSGIFEDIWIQPASGDAGGALGAALYVWYAYLNNPRTTDEVHDFQNGSFLGPEFSDGEIEKFLDSNSIPYEKADINDIPDLVADMINDQKVIGWFQGRMEFGPRALGARSIIGDARSPKMQETMNLKIKFRESFRPFAPSVLSEKAQEYFKLDRPSPYMLLTGDVKEFRRIKIGDKEKALFGIEKLNVPRSDIPAVTHIDYSARIQTVHKVTNPLYYRMMERFNEKYDCAVIVNTSFNVRGEPIVCTPEDAYRCFMRTNIDYLIMGPFILNKADQNKNMKDEDWKKEFVLD